MLDFKENIDKNLFYFHNTAPDNSLDQSWNISSSSFKCFVSLFMNHYWQIWEWSEKTCWRQHFVWFRHDSELAKESSISQKSKHSLLVRQKSSQTRHIYPVCYECVVWRETETRGGRPRPCTALSHLWTLDMGSPGFLGLNPSPTRHNVFGILDRRVVWVLLNLINISLSYISAFLIDPMLQRFDVNS